MSHEYEFNNPIQPEPMFAPQSSVSVPSPSPMYQPYYHPPLHVNDKRQDEHCETLEISQLIFDNNNEHMLLLVNTETESSREAVDFADLKVNLDHKRKRSTKDKILSNGCIRLLEVYCLADEKGVEGQPLCEVEIINRDPIERISIYVSSINLKDKSLLKVLGERGVTFIKDGFKVWCEKFSETVGKAKVQKYYMDFYRDTDNRLRHSHYNEIAAQAADSLGILERLKIDLSEMSDDSFLRLTLMLYGMCGKMFAALRLMGITTIAKLAIACPERNAALEDLGSMFCSDNNPHLFPGKLFEKQIIPIRNEVILIPLLDEEYMNKKCLGILSQKEPEMVSLPLLFSDITKYFDTRNDVLQLNYDLTGMGNINDIYCWAIRALLNDPSLEERIVESFTRYDIMLEQDTESISVRHLIALFMAMAEVYLPRLGVTKDMLMPVLQGYFKYLTESAGTSSVVIERLKEFLLSLRDIPIRQHNADELPINNIIYAKDDKLLFMSSTFEHTAKKCGTTTASLSDILAKEDILQREKSGYKYNISFGKDKQRMYAIKASSLFAPGELRPMCVNEKDLKPLYKLPIGNADDHTIYYDIFPLDSKDSNSFALVTGIAGSGKSTLCKTIAVNAAEQGLSVVCLGGEDALLDMECNIFVPSEDEAVSLERFIEDLCDVLSEDGNALADMAFELMHEHGYGSYEDILDSFTMLVAGDKGAEHLLGKAREICERLSGFSWDKAVVDGEISQVMAQSQEEAEQLLLGFYEYKSGQADARHTLLLLDEVQNFSWDGKSPLVSKILRQGRKYGIVGVFSTQYLNADSGKNIAAALKQISTQFVFRPSDEIAAVKLLVGSSGDQGLRNVLEMLDTGEAVAKGHISTDICALNYPVKFIADNAE